jgi:hypothetical protein
LGNLSINGKILLKYAPLKEDVVCRMDSLRSEWDPLPGTCEVGTENWYYIGTSNFLEQLSYY